MRKRARRKSRGVIGNRYLTIPAYQAERQPTPEAAKDLISAFSGIGGFSFLFGNLRDLKEGGDTKHGLAVVSNRDEDVNKPRDYYLDRVKGCVWRSFTCRLSVG